MLCPKCGREYEGNSCPYCMGPEIIVNNADYLRRKEEYEKKQADGRSASSDNEETVNEEALAKRVRSVYPEIIADKIKKGLNKLKSDILKLKNPKTYKKLRIILPVLAIAVLIIAAAALLLPKAVSKKETLYMSNDGKIYRIEKENQKPEADLAGVIFTESQDKHFEADMPDNINKDDCIQSMAAKSGKYFSAVTYDKQESLYTIFLWDKDNCISIANDKMLKSILYVTDKGLVVYSDTEYIDYEGNAAGTNLYIYIPDNSDLGSGRLIQIDENIKKTFIYDDLQKVVSLDKSDNVTVYDYDNFKLSSDTIEDVSCIYGFDEKNPDRYTYYAGTVNYSKKADGFMYCTEQKCYYRDLKTQKDIYLAQAHGTDASFVYKSGSFVYMINSAAVWYSPLSKDKAPEYKKVTDITNAGTLIFTDEGNVLVYVDENGNLIKMSDGKTNQITSGIVPKSLQKILNNDSGFTYIKAGSLYYKDKVSSNEVKIIENINAETLVTVVSAGNKLYFIKDDGLLYSCTKNGKNLISSGEADSFWIE